MNALVATTAKPGPQHLDPRVQEPKIPVIEREDIGVKVAFEYKEADDIEADIVAIHGIGDHPITAWTYEGKDKDKDKDKKINWLKDKTLLPAACPKTRILTFGYDSVWHGEAPSRQTVDSVARSLLLDLGEKRTKCPRRPIIFIGHCFGGLIMQRAYTLAKTNNHEEENLDIYNSITGLLSLGTPFHGAYVDKSVGQMWDEILAVGLQGSRNLINHLARDDDVLITIVHDFTCQIQDRRYPQPLLFCFYEQKETRFGDILGIKTDREFVVNESSGTLSGHPKEGLPLNHFEMNKFRSNEDNTYLCVSRQVKKMVEGSRKILDSRGVDKSSSASNTEQNVPSTTLPFARESNFVPRGELLEKIHERFGKTGIVALCGKSGIGKTHIAIEYTYLFYKEYPISQVHWIHAGNMEQLELSFKLVADSLGSENTEKNAKDKSAIASVSRRLKQDSHGHWLMILDGIDDRSGLDAAGSWKTIKSLLELIPKCNSGRLLITTRSKTLANSLLKQKDECIIDVPALDNAGASQLLLGKITKDEAKLKSALRVAKMLDYSPVSLTLAYTYRHVVAKGKPMSHYREKIKAESAKKAKEQEEAGVRRAWELLYDVINQDHPETARLMLLIASLDLQRVPMSLLAEAAGRDVDKRHIKTLVKYGMVEPLTNGRAITVTSMIRNCVQQWLIEHDQKALYEEKALSALCAIFPSPEEEEHNCAVLYPCATAILRYQKPDTSEARQERASLLFKVAKYVAYLRHYQSALAYLGDCLSLRQEDPDPDQKLIEEVKSAIAQVTKESEQPKDSSITDAVVPRTRDHVAFPHNWQEEYRFGLKAATLRQHDQAQAHYHAALESCTRLLGENSVERLRILGKLAITEFCLGHQEQALARLGRVFSKQLEVLGPNHPETLVTRHNGALFLQHMGRWNDAGEELHRVLNLRTGLLGRDNPSTISTLLALVHNYRQQGLLGKKTRVIEIDV